MTLGYEFQPVDVDLPNHPRVRMIQKRLRRAALGLYVAGLCYARQYRTDGALPFAFAEDDDPKLIEELVRVGLWVPSEAGGWTIFNWEKKSAGRKKTSEPSGASTARVKKLREKRAGAANETDVTVNETGETDTVASQSSSSSISSSLSGSDLSEADQINLTGGPNGVPSFFVAAAATAEQAVGRKVDHLEARFVEYEASRDRKRWPMGHKDAAAWLTTVVRSEARQAKEGTSRKRGAEITRQPYEDDAPWLKAGGED